MEGWRLGPGVGSDDWGRKQKGLGWRSLKIQPRMWNWGPLGGLTEAVPPIVL